MAKGRRGDYAGLGKIYNRPDWGVNEAMRRYNGGKELTAPNTKPADKSKPQFRQDQPTEWGGGDVDGRRWTRAPGEDATKRAGFDKMKNGRH
jgi:hypothetical protein